MQGLKRSLGARLGDFGVVDFGLKGGHAFLSQSLTILSDHNQPRRRSFDDLRLTMIMMTNVHHCLYANLLA